MAACHELFELLVGFVLPCPLSRVGVERVSALSCIEHTHTESESQTIMAVSTILRGEAYHSLRVASERD